MDGTERIRDIATDPDELEAFYREHLEAIRRFVARRVSDPHLAADLTSDIFMAAIDAAPGYRPERGTPRAWLHGIARNVVAGEIRRRVTEGRAVRRISGRRLLDPDSQARIEERIDAERQTRALYESIRQLPHRDRALVELLAVDELSVSDAAAALGIKPATARVRLHRIRRRLAIPLPAATLKEVTP